MRTLSLAACAWTAANLAGWARFRAALGRCREEQERLLQQVVRANRETAFGQAHGFARIRSLADYRERVPLARGTDWAPWVARIAAGERRILTEEPVRALQGSGGTTSSKTVPWTAGLSRQLRRAVAPWMVDLARHHPGVLRGRAYWSITPVGDGNGGFEQDSAYLGGMAQRVVDATLVVPAALRHVRDMEAFRHLTLLLLLLADDLALISVWHPSFLGLLLDALEARWDALLRDLNDGVVDPALEVPAPLRSSLTPRLRAGRRRAAALARLGPQAPSALWPGLAVVSCWGDGHAAASLEALRARLPGVPVQPKGLLATEGCVTVPFEGATPLAVRSHHFEFLRGGSAFAAHELETGGEYSVVLTTAGGFYRHCLEDRVQVTGWLQRTPVLRFLGKEDHVSDLRGEKLSEVVVSRALAAVWRERGRAPRFALLAPGTEGPVPAYTLYVEGADAQGLGEALEAALAAHGDYRYCRALGQLGHARVFVIEGQGAARYLDRCQQLGQRLGDVKPMALSRDLEWRGAFTGRYADEAPLVRGA